MGTVCWFSRTDYHWCITVRDYKTGTTQNSTQYAYRDAPRCPSASRVCDGDGMEEASSIHCVYASSADAFVYVTGSMCGTCGLHAHNPEVHDTMCCIPMCCARCAPLPWIGRTCAYSMIIYPIPVSTHRDAAPRTVHAGGGQPEAWTGPSSECPTPAVHFPGRTWAFCVVIGRIGSTKCDIPCSCCEHTAPSPPPNLIAMPPHKCAPIGVLLHVAMLMTKKTTLY